MSSFPCHCGGPTTVMDSRPVTNNITGIRRRRRCDICSDRFTTWEMALQGSPGILERADTVAKKAELVLAASAALLDELEALQEITKAHRLIAAVRYGNAGPQ